MFTDSVTDPYVVNILIDGTDHGSGSGASKKVAKNKAAIEALDKLIPGFKVECLLTLCFLLIEINKIDFAAIIFSGSVIRIGIEAGGEVEVSRGRIHK